MSEQRDKLYRVDYMTRAGWQPYFIAESPEVAKAYINLWEDKPMNWYYLNGTEMTRKQRNDGSYQSYRIRENTLVTMKEVNEIVAFNERRAVKS